MTENLEDSISYIMDIYHKKISPNNKNWKVLSLGFGDIKEFDEIYKKFGIGNDYNSVNILENSIPKGKWDLIIISEVIQYIFDYRGLINKCFKLLNDGGFFIINCPFIKEYDQKSKYPDYWRISHTAFQKILNDIGFEYGNCGLINKNLASAMARKAKKNE